MKTRRICTIQDCNKLRTTSAQYCPMHRSRMERHGDPNFVKQFQGNSEARFWQKVNKDGPLPAERPELGPCWIWTGANKYEYGQIRMGKPPGFLVQAHRLAL